MKSHLAEDSKNPRTFFWFTPNLWRYVLAISLAFLVLSSYQAYAGPARFNCGGGYYLAGDVHFLADRAYAPETGSGFVGGSAYSPGLLKGGPIEGTPYPELYFSMRYNPSEYRFDVLDGTYLLTLKFSELLVHGPDLNRFSVLAEGLPLLLDFDIFSHVEKNYAVTFRFVVQVSDDQLNVTFEPGIGQVVISAIEVAPIVADTTPPPRPLAIAAWAGYNRNILNWSPVQADDLGGYLVFRAPLGAGPFQLLTATPLTRFFDDDVLPGQIYIYRIMAADVFGNLSPSSRAVYTAPKTEATATLPVYKITLAPEDLAKLQADPMSDEYVPCDFEHDGLYYPDVKVRYRGFVTRLANKKSWKVNFTSEQPFQNRDKLELDAQDMDPSMVRGCLAFHLYDMVSTHSPECEFAHVQVNGEFRGVFSQIEDIDKDFLEARGLDTSGSLYESAGRGGANFRLHPTVEDYQQYWEKKTGEPGHGDVIELIELINLTPDEEFETALAAVFNVDSYLDYYATLIFTANYDHVHHNYFLYRNPSSNIWDLLPVDNDAAFYLPSLPLNYGTESTPGIFPEGPEAYIYNILTTRVLDVPSFRQRYVDKLNELLLEHFLPSEITPLIEEYHGNIAQDAYADVFKLGRQANETFVQSIGPLQEIVNLRHEFLLSQLDAFAPGIEQTIFINELLAKNSNDVTDDWGEQEDWVELYNPNPLPFDLTGHYLTDDLTVPTKWAFAPGTTVPAQGHLIIWADEDSEQGSLHASFKISVDGEALGLFGPDAEGNPMLDFIAFGPQETDVSFGRRYDESYLWATQCETSPGGPNTGPGLQP